MSLVPYKVTALKRVDKNGKNTLPGVSVSVFDQSEENAIFYTDATGATEMENPFNTDVYGEREIWISPGIYKFAITGGQTWSVSIGGAFFYQMIDDATTSYALNVADIGDFRVFTNAAAKSITIAPDMGVRGYIWSFINAGAGAATIVPGVGVTVIENAGGTLSFAQDSTISIMCMGANEYRLVGQTVAA